MSFICNLEHSVFDYVRINFFFFLPELEFIFNVTIYTHIIPWVYKCILLLFLIFLIIIIAILIFLLLSSLLLFLLLLLLLLLLSLILSS